jgi:heat shock protein HtpX
MRTTSNRLRIAVVIVLATLSYWLAVMLSAVATTLAVIVGGLLNGADFGFIDGDALAVIGVLILCVIALSAVVGSVIALCRLPFQRRHLEERVLIETGATIAAADDHPRVRNLLEGLAIAAGIPPPRFAILHTPVPNSFGVGTRPQNTIVAVTDGLIDKLTRDELEAVLAYEVSRIGSLDIALSSWTVALTAGAIDTVDDRGSDDRPLHAFFGYLPRVFAQWLQAYAVKNQVRERDRIALSFTRHPMALVRALEKLHADQSEVTVVTRATAPLWLEFPTKVAGPTEFGQRLARELGLDRRIAHLRAEVGLAPSAESRSETAG